MIGNSVGTGTLSDSAGNTWSLAKQQDNLWSGHPSVIIRYVQAPTTSAAHTFTFSGGTTYPSIVVAAFSGAAASPLDQTNGLSSSNGTSLATGSVTPTQNNELIIAATTYTVDGTTVSIDSGFTIAQQNDGAAGFAYGTALSYLIQTTAAAVNPTHTYSGTVGPTAAIATFKSA